MHDFIATAMTGIAALLLDGGTTVHSRFGIPLDLDENSTSMLSVQSERAHIIKEARVIVLDEATMGHKFVFHVLDRLLRDIMGSEDSTLENVPFGGKVILLAGDWRQLPPVVRHGGRAATVNASLKSSSLWPLFRVLNLSINMRVQLLGASTAAGATMNDFSRWLLDIGGGVHERVIIPAAIQADHDDRVIQRRSIWKGNANGIVVYNGLNGPEQSIMLPLAHN